MSEKLSDLDQEYISNIVSGGGDPSVSSAKANAEPSFTETHPLTMASIAGELEPAAGLAQWIGIHEPARYLNEIEQEARSTGRTGVGAAKFAGEMASLLAGGELTPGASAAIAKNPLLSGALTGGVTSAVMPTNIKEGEDYGDFLKQKGIDIAEGAGLGGAFGKGSQLIFAPIIGQKLQALKDIGMTKFTLGQLLSDVPLIGPALQSTEQAFGSMPFLGDFMQGGRQNAIEDFNKAIANHVLSPMGETTGKSTKVGHDLADEIYNKISGAYNQIAPELQFSVKFKNPETGETALKSLNDNLNQVTESLIPEDATKVASAYKKFIIDPLKSDLTMTGEQFRKAESSLGQAAYDAYKVKNTSMGAAYRELQANLRNLLAEQNPNKAQELSGIHDSFKRWLRLEGAAAKRGTDAGVFDPAQFASAVESLGGKNATARGKALMQEQSTAAEDVLGKKVPDSGTGKRLFSGLLLSGGANFLSGIPLAPTLAAIPLYSKFGMKAMTKLATERPIFNAFGRKIDMRALSPEVQTAAATAGGATANNYKDGGILVKFKKKSKNYAKGGIVKLAGGGVSEAFDQAKQNIADTYDTAKDFISNPTPYLNKFKQIPGIINDPAEPISHYLKGDISGGLASAVNALSEKSPEEIASGFSQPGAMGIVGSIENAGIKFTSPLNNTISSHKIESMPGSQWSSWLESNAPKAAKKEAEAVNLNSLLESNKNAKLTKTDILNHINAESPKVETKILGNTEALNHESPYATPEVLDVLKRHQGKADNAAQLALSNDYDAYQSLVEEHPGLVDQEGWEEKVVNDVMVGKYHPTRYENWQLPGGKNYKEILVKLPPKAMPFDEYIKHVPESIRSPEAREHLNNIYNEYVQDPGSDFSKFENYQSKHWDDPNVIAHLRMNDRITPEGKKMLHLEELQSDWGQQGKKYGFDYNHLTHEDINAQLIQPNVPEGHDPNVYGPHWEIRNKHTGELIGRDRGDKSYDEAVNPMLDWYNETNRSSSIPSAPYVTNTKDWTALGFKQALKHAAENNYEGITWTNGEQQADRYDLSKQLYSVKLMPDNLKEGKFKLVAYDHDNNRVINRSVEENNINDYIGKDLANKLLQQEPINAPKLTQDELNEFSRLNGFRKKGTISDKGEARYQELKQKDADNENHGVKKLEGLDIKVGGEGMKGYYDQILPQTVNDVMKQIGSKEKVQNVGIDLGEPTYALRNKTTGNNIGGGYSLEEAKQEIKENPNKEMFLVSGGTSHQMGVKLTPELKQKILKEGIPRFKQGGLLGKFKKK